MNEHSGTNRSTDPSVAQDPSRRLRRIDALQRAHRAREILARETELAVHHEIGRGRAGSGVAADLAGRAHDPRREDSDRLVAIHRGLQRERLAARRPFHRHSDRLVLALELAERLALERLGYADFADFESRHDDRPVREVIDLALIERAERDLADAEATLADLDREDDPRAALVLLPMWTNGADRRWVAPRRVTRTRRLVFGARRGNDERTSDGTSRLPTRRAASALPRRPGSATGPASVTPLPARLPRRDRDPGPSASTSAPRRRTSGVPDRAGRRATEQDVLDLDELVLAGLELDVQLPGTWTPTDRTPDLRTPDLRTPVGGTATPPVPATAVPDDEGFEDGLLGEIVHNGRSLRIEKVGGLVYADDDDDDPSAGAITYGDPNRPD